jgi:hypothetical protein
MRALPEPALSLTEIRADAESGVIDMLGRPHRGRPPLLPHPGFGHPGGRQRVHLHHVSGTRRPDEQFEAQYASLLREFENLEQRFGSTT